MKLLLPLAYMSSGTLFIISCCYHYHYRPHRHHRYQPIPWIAVPQAFVTSRDKILNSTTLIAYIRNCYHLQIKFIICSPYTQLQKSSCLYFYFFSNDFFFHFFFKSRNISTLFFLLLGFVVVIANSYKYLFWEVNWQIEKSAGLKDTVTIFNLFVF